MKKRNALWIAVAMVAVLSVVYIWFGSDNLPRESDDKGRVTKSSHGTENISMGSDKPSAPSDASISGTKSVDRPLVGAANQEMPLGETSPEDDRLVDAFDALTDKWIEPAKGGVTMKDIDLFVDQFKAVPKSRRLECLQRALNLVPDENVMLLAGILMDKSQDKELIQLVYNDVLNRDEDVKKPILRQIFADKEHPCWTDAAWMLDATGALPPKK